MAYPVRFNKTKAEAWLGAIGAGQNIRCPDGGCGLYDMVTLAGVCLSGVMSHGPVAYQAGKEQFEQLPPEHREAREDTFEKDLFAAILICAQMAFAIRADEYDHQFEDEVTALVYMDGVEKIMHPLARVKK
jgi:hypothetical protein